jgi:hypothetical protein
VTGAAPPSHDTPPGVPGRAGNPACIGWLLPRYTCGPSGGGGRVGQDHHARAEWLGAGELQHCASPPGRPHNRPRRRLCRTAVVIRSAGIWILISPNGLT